MFFWFVRIYFFFFVYRSVIFLVDVCKLIVKVNLYLCVIQIDEVRGIWIYLNFLVCDGNWNVKRCGRIQDFRFQFEDWDLKNGFFIILINFGLEYKEFWNKGYNEGIF